MSEIEYSVCGYSNSIQKPIPIPSTRIRFRYSVLVTLKSNRNRLDFDLGTDSASEYDSNTEFESDSITEYRNRTRCLNRIFGVGVLEFDAGTDSDTEYSDSVSVFGIPGADSVSESASDAPGVHRSDSEHAECGGVYRVSTPSLVDLTVGRTI